MSHSKTLQVKTKAVTRMMKEHASYAQELEHYNLQLIANSKKQKELYDETQAALLHVETKVI